MEPIAVAAVGRTRDGRVVHRLHVMEALSVDYAEAKVMTDVAADGQELISILRLSTAEFGSAAGTAL